MNTQNNYETIAVTEKEAKAIHCNDDDRFKRVDQTDWLDYGKYSHRSIVVKELATDKTWHLAVIRGGSYFTDYQYSYGGVLTLVEQRERVIKEWMPVEVDNKP